VAEKFRTTMTPLGPAVVGGCPAVVDAEPAGDVHAVPFGVEAFVTLVVEVA
jgi:hypothetical protein